MTTHIKQVEGGEGLFACFYFHRWILSCCCSIPSLILDPASLRVQWRLKISRSRPGLQGQTEPAEIRSLVNWTFRFSASPMWDSIVGLPELNPVSQLINLLCVCVCVFSFYQFCSFRESCLIYLLVSLQSLICFLLFSIFLMLFHHWSKPFFKKTMFL